MAKIILNTANLIALSCIRKEKGDYTPGGMFRCKHAHIDEATRVIKGQARYKSKETGEFRKYDASFYCTHLVVERDAEGEISYVLADAYLIKDHNITDQRHIFVIDKGI